MGASLLAVAKSIYYELVSLVHGVDICLSYNTAQKRLLITSVKIDIFTKSLEVTFHNF